MSLNEYISTALLENLNSMTSFTETSDITDWYALGWFLGVSEEELSEIEANYQRNDSKRQAVLDRWLETDREEASWLALAKAISKMRLHGELSKKIMKRDKLTKESSEYKKIYSSNSIQYTDVLSQ